MELPATTQRVTLHTDKAVNERIMKEMETRLGYYLDHPGEIGKRLRELDKEWDLERTLEANAASLVVAGVLLTVAVNIRFLLIPAVVGGFLFQHALQGWCPPVPVFRRLGTRTQSEIDLERYALKALRGDFEEVTIWTEPGDLPSDYPGKVLQALTQ